MNATRRKTFSGKGPWTSLEQFRNAIRAETINALLDKGQRVFGDDGPDSEGTWHEIQEAIYPNGNGIDVRTTSGKNVRIYSYDSTDKRAQSFDGTAETGPHAAEDVRMLDPAPTTYWQAETYRRGELKSNSPVR